MDYHYKINKYRGKIARFQKNKDRQYTQHAGVDLVLPSDDMFVKVSITAFIPEKTDNDPIGDQYELHELTVKYPKILVYVNTTVGELMSQLGEQGDTIKIPIFTKNVDTGEFNALAGPAIPVDTWFNNLVNQGVSILVNEQNRLWGRNSDSDGDFVPNLDQVKVGPDTKLGQLYPGFDPRINNYRDYGVSNEEYDVYGIREGILITIISNDHIDDYQRIFNDDAIISIDENTQHLMRQM